MKPLPISEPAPVAEPFCTHVVRVELVGPCCRAVLGAQQTVPYDGNYDQEVVINARLVMTPDCAVQLARQLLATVETRAEPATFPAAARAVN
jgi:hypothetical protein